MRAFPISLLAAYFMSCVIAFADEGLWLYNEPPSRLLQERYGFSPDKVWLENVQKSSVHLGTDGSGAFVSEDGLIITTYHGVVGTLRKVSDKGQGLRDGFYAAKLAEEKPCAGLAVDVLDSIEDVTDRVKGSVKPGVSGDDAIAARRSAAAGIEKESQEKTGLRSRVISLYGGSKWHLYRYKHYDDVRLVFAPEQEAVTFGDGQNVGEFPEYSFDCCLFRAYENGNPAKIANFLKWSASGVDEKQLVFISGNPGRMSRELTCSELDYLRDNAFPFQLQWLYRNEILLRDWSARSEENARRAKDDLLRVQTRRKATERKEAALLDPELMAAKRASEKKLREVVTPTPELQDTIPVWDQITAAQRVIAVNARRYAMFEGDFGFNSRLFDFARILFRSAIEKDIPNSNRLPEYQDSNLASLKQELFAEEPLYEDLEILKLTDSLSWLAGELGTSEFGATAASGESNLVLKQALADQTPLARATALVTGTKLRDIDVRKNLYSATFSNVMRAKDPMIDLARAANPDALRLSGIIAIEEGKKEQGHEKIAAARYFFEKGDSAPEATSSPRFAFGAVRGYQSDAGMVSFQTTLSGLFERGTDRHAQSSFSIPTRWAARKNKLNLTTPFNFFSTADIAGGFSGSPVINAAGEFVGLVYGGNSSSSALDFAYTDTQARAVSLDSRAIMEVLRHVYGAGALADEMESGRRTK